MKKILFITGYYIFAVVIIFLILEVIIRIFFPVVSAQGTQKELFDNTMYFGARGLIPHSSGYSNGKLVQVDAFGCRQCTSPIDTTKRSWLLLGDSVTFGIGAESDSTFACIVQNRLDSINVLNPSVIGNAVNDYLAVVDYFIVHNNFNLDIRRLTIFYCLNDLYFGIKDEQAPGGNLRYVLGDFLRFFQVHSRFYTFLKKQVSDRPKSYFLFDTQFYSSDNPLFQKAMQGLVDISETCARRNIAFDIVLLPYEYQLRLPNSNLSDPQRLVQEALAGFSNIHIYNPGDYLQQHSATSEQLFLYGDGIHFSHTGHRLIAAYLLENLLHEINN